MTDADTSPRAVWAALPQACRTLTLGNLEGGISAEQDMRRKGLEDDDGKRGALAVKFASDAERGIRAAIELLKECASND